MSEVWTSFRDHSAGGRVATVCHDNADKLNVIDGEGAAALAAAVRRAGESRDVRVIVLRGAGDRALIGGTEHGSSSTAVQASGKQDVPPPRVFGWHRRSRVGHVTPRRFAVIGVGQYEAASFDKMASPGNADGPTGYVLQRQQSQDI